MSTKKKGTGPYPKYCTEKNGAIYCNVYLGKDFHSTVPRTSHRLCDAGAPLKVIEREYQKHIADLKARQGGVREGSLSWLLQSFMKSDQFRYTKRARKPKSQKYIDEQTRQAKAIIETRIGGGGKDTKLGDVMLREITPGMLTKYCDKRAADNAPIAGNREIALISVAWNWALSRDHTYVPNSCLNCTRNPENPRDHYVTDEEYNAWLLFLLDCERPHMYAASEIMYLCRLRKVEVLEARKSQVLEEGFDTIRRKGSRHAITEYSPRLRAALDMLKQDKGNDQSEYLVTFRGRPHTIDGFNRMWDRCQQQCVEQYGIRPFTRHDLKRKGASDSDQDATISTGNTPAMTKVYDVSKIKAKSTR